MLVPLLTVLDARVRSDLAPPGFTGTLCVVVRGASGETIWSASFGSRASCGVVDRVPDDASAVLLVGEGEADALVRTGAPPPQPRPIVGAGDRALLESFLERYAFRDWLDVRAERSRR